jgi:hypothetical protein
MAHATSQGLKQESGPLTIVAQTYLPQIEPRGVTSQSLTDYNGLVKTMEDKIAASGGETSDKEQLTEQEVEARDIALAEIRRIQGGAKRSFPKGSPQLKEFFVGEKNNHSTALLIKWAKGIATAWDKYTTVLTTKGNLVAADKDALVAAAASLGSVDSTQESAKHKDVPEATAQAWQAMDAVEEAADFIYGAASAQFYNKPEILGQFEAIKPLRYAVVRVSKKNITTAAKVPAQSVDTAKK